MVAAGFVSLAALELTQPGVGNMERPTAPASLLDGEYSVAEVYAELYPKRTSSYYFRALQAHLCSRPPHRRKPECRKGAETRAATMRALLARAVDAGNRSNEKVIYNYALVLIAEGAPAEEIDASIRRWRLDHPYSSLPDPRAFAAPRGPRAGRGGA